MKYWYCIFLAFLASSLLFCTSSKKDHSSHQVYENYIQLENTTLGITEIASRLEVPWEITWGPDNWIWFTEQSGKIGKINPRNGKKKYLVTIPDVWMKRTTGLLGMVIHPNQKHFPYLFVNYTTQRNEQYINKLVRYEVTADSLLNPITLLEIGANTGHNGARLILQNDTHLFWATGDIAKKGYAQDSTKLEGKILRLTIDGKVPIDNPIPNSYVYAWGLRNMQGMVQSPQGNLYVSEHGDAIEDEVNLIKPLRNYGWENIEGFHNTEAEKSYAILRNTEEPLISWTPTIAPAGLDYYNHNRIPEWKNSLLLTSLKNASLRVLSLNAQGSAITNDFIALQNHYGRLRDLCISPNGDIYIATSNKDWNPGKGFPTIKDDRILKLSPVKKALKTPLNLVDKPEAAASPKQGALLYSQYCQSCHKEDGNGVAGTFPALNQSQLVNGLPQPLTQTVLNGTNSTISMPSFSFLNDEELAAILTYIRSNWKNGATPIVPSDVKQLRK